MPKKRTSLSLRLGVRLVDFIVAKSGCDMLRPENAAALLERPSNWQALSGSSPKSCSQRPGSKRGELSESRMLGLRAPERAAITAKVGRDVGGGLRDGSHGGWAAPFCCQDLSCAHGQETVSRVALELFKRLAEDESQPPASPFACAFALPQLHCVLARCPQHFAAAFVNCLLLTCFFQDASRELPGSGAGQQAMMLLCNSPGGGSKIGPVR